MVWIDLTRNIQPGMVTWAGDPPPEIIPDSAIALGKRSNTSILRLASHLGTHLDAPRHIIEGAKSLEQLDLDSLIGKARVIDLSHLDRHITRADLEEWLTNKETATSSVTKREPGDAVRRVLLKTKSGAWFNEKDFRQDFIALLPDAAQYLVDCGICLVGIDYLSIEPYHYPDHLVHKILLEHEMVIVEGLDLSQLKPGEVEFICLPLRILGGDGSPCRAVARVCNT
jgi:arylformamidase